MSLKQVFFKDSIIYGSVSYLSIFVAIFLTPIYSRTIPDVSYGIMDVFNTWVNFAIGILPLGTVVSLVRYYPDIKDNESQKKETVGNIVSILIGTCSLLAIIGLFLKRYWLYTFVGDTTFVEERIFDLSIYIIVANVLLSLIFTFLRVKFEKYKYLAVALINFFLLSGLGVVFVIFNNQGILGFFYASTIAVTVANIVGFVFIYKEFYFSFNPKKIESILSFSIHFLSTFFLYQITNIIDRYVIKEFLGMSELGNYSIAVRVAGMTGLFLSAFATAWTPYAMTLKNEKDGPAMLSKAADLYAIIGFLLAGGIIMFRFELLKIFAPDFFSAYTTIGVLAILNVITSSAYIYGVGILFQNQSKYMTIATIYSIIVNIILTVVFVKIFGLYGVALGSVFAAVVFVGYQYRMGQKSFPIPYSFKLIYIFAPALAAMFFLSHFIDFHIPLFWMVLTLIKVAIMGLILLVCLKVAKPALINIGLHDRIPFFNKL